MTRSNNSQRNVHLSMEAFAVGQSMLAEDASRLLGSDSEYGQ